MDESEACQDRGCYLYRLSTIAGDIRSDGSRLTCQPRRASEGEFAQALLPD
jgi:hypothetical protein